MKKKPSSAIFCRFRRGLKRVNAALAVFLSIGLASPGLQAQGPSGGVVTAGDAHITGEGTVSTRIDQLSDRAVIDWRSFGVGVGSEVIFLQPSAQSAILNRVTGEQVSLILGRLDANGHVLLINPNGIVFGAGAEVNVGSLIATTSNVSNANFMSGRLVFDQPGRLGAGVFNAGNITAKDGGLIALVAPHVRNDGVIVARLGRVTLGAADSFTVDLYGDGLINLALSDAHAGQLFQPNGEPVTSLVANKGRINTAGGETVLITARTAKNVLDNLINTSGTIRADSAVQQGGRILLFAEGGTVTVDGTLSAQGNRGGTIQVLGDQVHLSSGANLDASGANGGGLVQVGGAWQGQGDTYRSSRTIVDAGATLNASATKQGNGGEVVVWSNGNTTFAGSVEARGGSTGGDGGRMEVSGKGALEFLGQADASAASGYAGTLLLDPAFLNIGDDEAGVIARVLRTGTSTSLQADVDINVDSAIFGGDRLEGGGLTMTAGNNINLNNLVVTNNGAVNMFAANVHFAPGAGVFAGYAPISIKASGDLRTGFLFTGGSLSIASLTGSVIVDSLIDGHTSPITISAANNVDIDQPIVNLVSGTGSLSVTAGSDINVNATVDGRGGEEGGGIAMTASRNLNVNDNIVTNNGALSLTAVNGSVNVASDAVMVSGTSPMTLKAQGDITTGAISASTLTIASTSGSVTLDGLIDGSTGNTRVDAGADVNINQAVLNGQSGGSLIVNANRDVNVSGVIDGRAGVAGGTVAVTAGRSVNVNEWVATNNGAITLTAASGSLAVAGSKGLVSGSAPIVLRSAGDLSTGAISGGSLAATSSAGSVRVNGVIDGNTGHVNLIAAQDVSLASLVLNGRTGSNLTATAGRDVLVNDQINGLGGAAGGRVTLTAARNVAINNSIVTNNGFIKITATGGSATMASGTALVSGNQGIEVNAANNVTLQGISGGSLRADAGGSVYVNGVIDGSTGGVVLKALRDVNVNSAVLNTRNGSSFSAEARQGNINVNGSISGLGGAPGGSVTLDAFNSINVNASISTNDGAVRLTATTGAITFASGVGVFAGSGAISLSSYGPLIAGILNGGSVTLASTTGPIVVGGPLITSGPLAITSAGQLDINQSIFNPGGGSTLTLTAGTDLNLNAQVGRSAPGVTSGAVTMTAGNNVNLNKSVVTEGGAISVTATSGTVTAAGGEGLFAGTGSISVVSGQTFSTPIVSTSGAVSLTSTGGSVNVDNAIAGTSALTIAATSDVNINEAIANPRPDALVSISAGNDINLNAIIDGRDLVLTGPSGGVTMTAGNNIALNDDIVQVNSAISLSATNGTLASAATEGLFSGSGAITLQSNGDLTTGAISGGSLVATSSAGSVNVGGVIDGSTGAVTLTASQDVNIAQAVLSPSSGNGFFASAGRDVLVNAQIDGRVAGGVTGGGVTLVADRNVAVNSAVVTNDGAIDIGATTGTVTMAGGTALGSGNQAITVSSAGDIALQGISGGSLDAASTGGSVSTNGVIDGSTGNVALTANQDVNINNTVLNTRSGASFTATAGADVNVNAQIDATGGVVGGTVALTATDEVNLNASITTLNGAINVTAQNGAATSASGTGLYAGTGAISVDSQGTLTAGELSGGTMNVTSNGGSVALNGAVGGVGGNITIGAAGQVDINQSITNPGASSALAVTAGTNINVNAQVGRTAAGVNSGAVTMTAADNVNVNDSIVTENGAINVTATNGAINTLSTEGYFSGTGAIALQSNGDLTTGIISGASLDATSTAGTVNVNGVIDGGTGDVTLTAALDVNITQAALNGQTGGTLDALAGRDVLINAQIDGRGGVAGGGVILTAERDVAINNSIVTNDGTIDIAALTGAATMAAGTELGSGNDVTLVQAEGDVTLRDISAGALVALSNSGSVSANGVIDGSTGDTFLIADQDVNINGAVLNTRTGSLLYANTAVGDINVNAQIDATGGVGGDLVILDAANDLNVNASITSNDGSILLSTLNGATTFAPGTGLYAGTGEIAVDSEGTVTAGEMSGGLIDVFSNSGAIAVNGAISGTGDAVTLDAGTQVDINQSITNPGAFSPLTITAGTNINLNAQIGRAAIGDPSGNVTMTAGNTINLNDSIVTEGGAINVTATSGAVTTGITEGLFAGTGNISVVSGSTLSTPTTSTTGTVFLRSTGGSVNVAKAIDGTTGAVTIQAASNVNINQAINNPRADAPLTITAGGAINVNANIDGDNGVTNPSGTVTMTAGTNIALNQDIVTKNRAISLTATSGSITFAALKGLYAGTGPISLTSGLSLTPGITTTTGALNLTSTGGAVNINTAIPNTTGDVTINAGTAVNINSAITNLKSGNDLNITAGTNINVAAKVDGRSGDPSHVAGGTVTMTAGNNITLTSLANTIATNNGAVSLTATNGTLTLPDGPEFYSNNGTPGFVSPQTDDDIWTPMQWMVSAGNQPITVTTGGNFSLTSPLSTTGALSITSTGGNVDIKAPITKDTGAVTITAGNALNIYHQVKSNDQDITLNAGAGGITIQGLQKDPITGLIFLDPITGLPVPVANIVDYDLTNTSPVNSRDANLTLNSVGDVSILDSRGISSSKIVTIDTRGHLVTGSIGNSNTSGDTRPDKVILIADQGITTFTAAGLPAIGEVDASSIGGSINLTVERPGKLTVTTGNPPALDCTTCDIQVNGFDLGPDVTLNAGGTINLPDSLAGNMSLTARSGDVNLNYTEVTGSGGLTVAAGRDILMSGDTVWIGSNPNTYAGALPPQTGGPLTLTAGRDINTSSSPIHISASQAFTATAGRNLTLDLLETLGAVSLTATTGDITLHNDIGPHINNTTTWNDFNPLDKGVASLAISASSASATIDMFGARAQGNVVITTGGTLVASRAITSVAGSVTITAPTQFLSQAIPIGTQNQMDYPVPVAPAIAPGPSSALPTPPGLASGAASGAPAFAEILPPASGQNVGFASGPGAAAGSVSFGPTPAGAAAPGGAGSATTPGAATGSVSLGATPGGAGTPGFSAISVPSPGTPGSSPSPGAPGGSGSVAAGSTSAGTGAPGRSTGAAGRPGVTGSGTASQSPSGSSDTSSDAAAAERAAGNACSVDGESDDETGLEAVTQDDQETSDGEKAACPQ